MLAELLMKYLGSILASSSGHWSAQLAARSQQHPPEEINLRLKPVTIPLMRINGRLRALRSPQHERDLQALSPTQSYGIYRW